MVGKVFRWLISALIAFLAFSLLATAVYRWLPVTLTPLMLVRAVENLSLGKSVKFERTWTSLEKISPKLVYAVIAAEDMKFFEHNGFDWEAIDKARLNNREGKRLRGASTISQQVAKNVFLWPQRSWLRKSIEAYFTTLIELMWSKERILEVYLNVAELGDGVYGFEAASRRFFRKPAFAVNSSEAALLAAVLPNPRRMKVNQPTTYVRLRQKMIQRRMRKASLAVFEHRSSSHPNSSSFTRVRDNLGRR
jgi:monofunctional glycosyltransferase